ncbi:NAD-dependent epimerase/dehydratase family protein [Litorilinea aerophila]|uniref:NAD-dependent epimerase/dehydratase family protein n=1 Tax=Litorilinea aerophila TaxID=1204385 RepID=A0A540VJS0_9CHLR|nr:NAD-dependent epimerase/dehydratase family protein [Litorilinea aerophila]MCC9075437.1 NAD-dependent epimerase/dehydratase family protein [Litorilinea aerophila]
MQTVFITGATGYIGFSVAQAFRRAGYAVLGLTRSPHKARFLAQREIQPVVGAMQEPDTYRHLAAQADILIHAAVDYQADTAELDRLTVETLLAAARQGTTPRTLIYTSGVWVHGDTGGDAVDESSPLAPAAAVAWRPAVEDQVLTETGVRGLVLRPGVVYGGAGGLTGLWFDGATNGHPFDVVGDGRNHWSMVHVGDLAQGYVLAAQSGLAGEVFNLVDGVPRQVSEMVTAIGRATGTHKRPHYRPLAEAVTEMGPLAEALALDQKLRPDKATRFLGWHPQHPDFVADVHTYYRAWQAQRQQ